MNRLWSILLTVVFATTLSGCNQTEETNLDQAESIVSFLESSHSPTLISESDAAESLDNEPEFYVSAGSTTFRYIEDYYNEERDSREEVKKGSVIDITISLYDFSSFSTPTIYTLLYTNSSENLAYLEALGLNLTYQSDEPLTIKVGAGALFSGVETLLIGCKEGDNVEFYMTLDEAYGTSIIGLSSTEAPLALFCEILEVNN